MPVAETILAKTEALTPAQYLVQERLAEAKSEYIDEELLPLPGVSLEHDRIVRSILRALENQLVPEHCEPFTSDMGVQLAGSRFVYPLVNPTVIFEVLSDSTLNNDLGEKARLYRQRDSLQSLCTCGARSPRGGGMDARRRQ